MPVFRASSGNSCVLINYSPLANVFLSWCVVMDRTICGDFRRKGAEDGQD
jgi:hypothetical protein